MTRTAEAPGLRVVVERPPSEPDPLRTDVAAFVGPTARGPVGAVARVEGWSSYTRLFGPLGTEAHTPYCIRGYFENGGQIAHVVRLLGKGAGTARGTLDVAGADPDSDPEEDADTPAPPWGFGASRYEVLATSPGRWASGGRVTFAYRRAGFAGEPEVDVTVELPGEPVERHTGLVAGRIEEELATRSSLVRLCAISTSGLSEPGGPPPDPVSLSGPTHLSWEVRLEGGSDPPPGPDEYLAATALLGEGGSEGMAREVALVALPDLYDDLPEGLATPSAQRVLDALLEEATATEDRLILLEPPPGIHGVRGLGIWAGEAFGRTLDGGPALHPRPDLRHVAVYHPRLAVPDPAGRAIRPLRVVPPVGHVAGLISLLDRNRGPQHTPANATLDDVVDLTASYEPQEAAALNRLGVNLIRCIPGRGLAVWGGRTMDPHPSRRFIAHRRLVHRLVRAVRRVAEPLVFDTNGPELRLTLTRAVTTVLLEAYRAGGLKGARPEEAFRVRCDERTNPPEARDVGRVVCEIQLAPAVPMEFILIRVALDATGGLEVEES